MKYFTEIKKVKETKKGTYYIGFIPDEYIDHKLKKTVTDNLITAEIRFNDGRRISSDQRKKIFAILGDISKDTGNHREELKEIFKKDYCKSKDVDYFSLSNRKPHAASVTIARDFTNYLIDFVLRYDIALDKRCYYYTDDIPTYIYMCLKYKKCSVCGRPGEIHHWDAIGMGRDREKIEDNDNRKICLCREHHTEAHAIGKDTFKNKYKLYGVIYIGGIEDENNL